VFGSTIGIYGSAGGGTLDEGTPPRPENIYACTKLEAEKLTADVASRIETCIIRISEVYGPGDLRLLKLFRGVDKGIFRIIGSGANLRQVIYVRDLVRGLLLAACEPGAVGQTFVLAGTEIMTTTEMVRQVATTLGRKPPSWHLPFWPFRAAAMVLEATLRPLGIQPPLTQRRLDFFSKSFTFATDKARTRLGFTPEVSFASGAALTAQWYREQGLVGKR
jgi:nucleoside-diphosphate-sugar epimerase